MTTPTDLLARLRPEPVDGMPWQLLGACRDHDPEMWFHGENATEAQWSKPRAICNACPVIAECRAAAFERGEDHGMWGGLTPQERTAIHKRPPRTREFPAAHGTDSGYNRHHREGTPPCDGCRAAHAAARKARAVRNGAA